MHDTFLFERISNEVVDLCEKNKIKELKYICVTVHKDSHVDDKSLLHHLKDKNTELVGNFTKVQVLRNHPEPLVAIIHQIEGI
jgi:UDP-N-acetylglucosamine 2-epimerase